jgi:hypothetical protein
MSEPITDIKATWNCGFLSLSCDAGDRLIEDVIDFTMTDGKIIIDEDQFNTLFRYSYDDFAISDEDIEELRNYLECVALQGAQPVK